MAYSLNHFSIRTMDIDATRAFYETVLGLTVGPRPSFPFPGLWLYNGDTAHVANAMVHVIGMDKSDPQGLKDYLGDKDVSELHGTGAIDHIALMATGLEGMLAHLNQQGVPCRERSVPAIGLHQLFLDDPSGVVIELNYPAEEKAQLDARINAKVASAEG